MPVDDGRGTVVAGPKDLFGDEFTNDALATTPDDDQTPGGTGEDDPNEPGVRKAATSGFERSIDLGDGSGVQVFRADTAEGLIDKLYDAQINATKKIKEQAYELKKSARARPERFEPATPKEPANMTADELFALATELQKNPDAAFDKILKHKTGRDSAALKNTLDSIDLRNSTDAADREFLREHGEEWVPSSQNASRMQKFLQDEKLPYTAANLKYAFQELTESGLLDAKARTEPAGDGGVQVAQHNRRKPMSTGLRNSNASGRSPVVTEKPAMSESEAEQLSKMNLEDGRVFISKIMARVRSSQR